MSNDPWSADWDGPKELLPLLARGKLDQICMECGMTDPAGGPCSRCGAIVLWTHWHPTYRTKAQRLSDVRRGKTLKQNRSHLGTETAPVK